MFWHVARGCGARAGRRPRCPTSRVAVGNQDECEVAVGERDPEAAAKALLDARRRARRRQAGPEGRARRDPATSGSRCRRPRSRSSTASARATPSAARCATACWPAGRSSGSLRFANAAGAIVASRLACSTAMPTTAEVEALLAGGRPADERHSCRPRRASRGDPRAHPERVAELAARRASADPRCAGHNRLMLVAADHPARGALGAGDVATAMADRAELLRRLVRALAPARRRRRARHPGHPRGPAAARRAGRQGRLRLDEPRRPAGGFVRDRRPVHRLRRADPASGCGFDGGKMLLRIDLQDAGTARTLEHCARAVTALATAGLMAMVEPFMSSRQDGRVRNDLTAAGGDEVGRRSPPRSARPAPTPGSSCRSWTTWSG